MACCAALIQILRGKLVTLEVNFSGFAMQQRESVVESQIQMTLISINHGVQTHYILTFLEILRRSDASVSSQYPWALIADSY